MQHRKSASMSVVGRPSGTDGSDFSYRMVVASRYTKVAQGKSRLCKLIIIQAVIQVIRALYTFLALTKEEDPNVFAVSSIGVGFVSLLIGELGRRRSKTSLLKIYMVASSIAVLISVACLTKSKAAMTVIQDPSNLGTKKFGLFEISHALVGLLVHIFAISTTVSLIGNMSPPKKSS